MGFDGNVKIFCSGGLSGHESHFELDSRPPAFVGLLLTTKWLTGILLPALSRSIAGKGVMEESEARSWVYREFPPCHSSTLRVMQYMTVKALQRFRFQFIFLDPIHPSPPA